MNSYLWSYSGAPEYVSIRLKPVYPAIEGGFIVFIRLTDNRTWIYASNDPGKCVTNWKNIAKNYGLPAAEQVVVSRPVLLYSTVKSKILEKLEPYRIDDTGGYMADMETIMREAEEVLKMAVSAILHGQ
ncbi:hypothetical protein FBR06_10970 [Betaproteobacteria bacterium PRO4]|uniref:hypothetical protein n=1 Tax=Nitrosomonas sp. TaxID=42353 RepID=UPI00256E43F1|nr:hypothetical protein [Nitrosomonas sp.]MDL1867722.1 hypothetical protein [Betaproteobacteria bacterium PRO4]